MGLSRVLKFILVSAIRIDSGESFLNLQFESTPGTKSITPFIINYPLWFLFSFVVINSIFDIILQKICLLTLEIKENNFYISFNKLGILRRSCVNKRSLENKKPLIFTIMLIELVDLLFF